MRSRERHAEGCEREGGQALVEFALILFPLLLIVAGVLHFGIGLNYWLDMNRLANQGARWAAVDRWPGCPATGSCPQTLQAYIKQSAVSQGLRNSSEVKVCFPTDPGGGAAGEIGTPVKVRITSPFRLVRLFPAFNLRATTTMRLEQEATRYSADTFTPPDSCGS